MSIKKVNAKFCDVDKCGKPAKHKCANCGNDLCDTEHSHGYGDGGHIEHAIPLEVITFPYGGPEQIYLCPKCYTSPLQRSLFELFNESGVQLIEHDGMG
jgi:hypothetical protein